MGAWGHGVFDNDMACDWAGDLGMLGRPHVHQALQVAASCGPRDYLDADDGQMAVAAAEVVARWLGHAGAPFEPVDTWVGQQSGVPDPSLVRRAVQALDRVLAPSSEIASLWGPASPWHAEVTALRARLGP